MHVPPLFTPLPLAIDPVAFNYWPIVLLLTIAVGFAVLVMIGTHILGPQRTGPEKETTYESGVNPVDTARKRFNVRYYLLAMTFLVFDVEIIFLYPWATTFRQIDADSQLATMFVCRILFFLLTSVIAYAYAWRKGVFRFD
ncbi:MAG: NADH-quinone oxidoreductase subunit A [Planctomycetes bacterium]|nr:NADH-quinone oxidoreductase subunit A [Planctomycetota bacterium]NOG54918.1 NAD(P)H-quinone oxidoreductase subunit 3 [Planctomycetota bacterium]